MSAFKKDNVALMCDVAELAGLFDYRQGLDAFLARVISTVAWHMRAAVCSIYLYDESARELVLSANQGLNPDFVNRLRLRTGEGLVGKVLRTLRPVCEGHAASNPDYKFVPGLEEERFVSFLAVPLLRKNKPVGVMSVQDPEPDYFTPNDVQALQVISSQLGGLIGNARILLALRGAPKDAASAPPPPELPPAPPAEDPASAEDEAALLSGTHLLHARPGGSGVVHGLSTRIGHYLNLDGDEAGRHNGLTEADFDRALAETERQLLQLQKRLEDRLLSAASLIFDAHVLMLKDEAFSGQIRSRIRQGLNPWAATLETVRTYARVFSSSPDPSFREKTLDVEDLGRRLLHNLHPDNDVTGGMDYTGRVIVAEELLPSDLLKLATEGASGIVLLGGGQASHVAILARALRIPIVFASDRRLLRLPERTPLLLDARSGEIILRPDEPTVTRALRLNAELGGLPAPGSDAPAPANLTADGTRIRLAANLNLVGEIEYARQAHADGIGLYRTEFPFIIGNTFPSEEEQYAGCCHVLERMPDRPVTFRTLDIGGDKALSYYPLQHENNPFLGLRALRFSLRNPKIFRSQLRALLRAAATTDPGRLRVMFPLVASLDEFLAARAIALSCAEDLRREGTPCRLPPFGIMIELPSAVILAPELAAAADFLSIGSNDLVQYILAVDRTNQAMARWYTPRHPAVLRAIAYIVACADQAGKPVSLCGDIASDPRLLPFLLGIGLRELSMDPQFLPDVQRRIASIDLNEAAKRARDMLLLGRAADVEAALPGPPSPPPDLPPA